MGGGATQKAVLSLQTKGKGAVQTKGKKERKKTDSVGVTGPVGGGSRFPRKLLQRSFWVITWFRRAVDDEGHCQRGEETSSRCKLTKGNCSR